MRNTFIQKIYYADTDAYGVVWHGAYLRWMEKGRCDFCEDLGFNLVELVKQDIALPVANMNVKFKASAKLNDKLVVETWISKLTPLSVTFSQSIKNTTPRSRCRIVCVSLLSLRACATSGAFDALPPPAWLTFLRNA